MDTRTVRLVPSILLLILALTAAFLGTVGGADADPAQLRVVGVLGNTAGLSDRPIPYAFYTGIANDARGRLYLIGATGVVPVVDQDGNLLAEPSVPVTPGMLIRSLGVHIGDYVYFLATSGNDSALYRIDTRPADAQSLVVVKLASGAGIWTVSQLPDARGRLIVGESEPAKLVYHVVAFDPISGAPSPVFDLAEPKGSMQPWLNSIEAEPSGAFRIDHRGGVNFGGTYSITGTQIADAPPGMLVGNYRYAYGYDGGLIRTDASGKPSPGDAGYYLPELRMAGQMVQIGDRYFFAGRGGVAEGEWTGSNIKYTRRIGAISLSDMSGADTNLLGIAFTKDWSDVQAGLTIPKSQPIGQLLEASHPFHTWTALAVSAAPEGVVYVYRDGKGVGVSWSVDDKSRFELTLPEVKEVGQVSAMGRDMLIADPASATIWRRPMLDPNAPVSPWRITSASDAPVAVSATTDAVYVSTRTTVSRLSLDGKSVAWTSPVAYKGVRRLSATAQYVYVCDTAGDIVDQLDASTGSLLARLGTPGVAGSDLKSLDSPAAVVADLNGVYISDPKNGRILVATTTLWRPDIARLPRQDKSPITAAVIAVKPPSAGRMSVNVYDMNGVTVRQLVCGQPTTTPVVWDGRDLYGHWAAPGTYRYYGIMAPKLSLKYITSVGQSGNPPYRTADGRGSWGGVWGYVSAICPVTSAPDSDIVVLWRFEEGEGGLIRMSQNGEVRWKAHLDWWMKADQTAVTSDGTNVYVACASAMGAPSGQTNYGGDSRRPMVWRVDAATGAKKLYAPSDTDQPMFGDYVIAKDRVVTQIAAHDGKLYLACPAENHVYVADAATCAQVAAWPIDNVSGIVFTASGEMLVGSGSKIEALAADGTVSRTIADAGGEIWGLAMTPDGNIVASVDAPRNQVVYFSPAGKEIKALGQMGGRPSSGKMIPDSFYDPVGLTVTGNGKLFVAENGAPKRFTRWSPAGTLEKQFNGPYYYSGMFAVDDTDPEYVYGDTHGDIIRYKVDYATGQWVVDRYWMHVYTDTGIPAKWFAQIRHHNGHTYWCSGSGAVVDLTGDTARGAAAVYGGWVAKDDAGNYAQLTSGKKGELKGTWSDANGDGKMQPGEWRVTAKPVYSIAAGGPQQGWGCYFDTDFNLYMADWSDTDPGGVWKLPCLGWQGDSPYYDWEKAVYVGKSLGHGLLHGGAGARAVYATATDVFGFNGAYNAANIPGIGHGHDWEFAQITRYDPATGLPVWHAGERAPGYAQPGQVYCPSGPGGVLDDYLFWTDENSLIDVWDVQHGLYVDTLLDDISRGPDPSPYTIWVELFNSHIVRAPISHKVFLYAASDAIHIFEVDGLDQPPTQFGGTFTLTADEIAKAKERVAAQSVAGVRSLELARASSPPKIDGDLSPFAQAPSAALPFTDTASASVRLMYDDKNVYAAFNVVDASPWKNAGGDIGSLFKTGDTVSLWFGPSAGARKPDTGDVRILFAPNGDKTTVVAYRPVVADGAQPVTLRSPSGAVTFDRIEPLTDVPVTVVRTDTGYRLEAAIPRSEIGLPSGTTQFGLDIDVNFSDPAGQRNVADIRWGRNGAAMVYDLPTEARFDTQSWGVGVLGP